MTGTPVLRVAHVALWVRDVERVRDFYVDRLGGTCGPMYDDPSTGFRSCFVSFGEGTRIELMSRSDVAGPSEAPRVAGWAHVALSVGGEAAVDALVDSLRAAGVRIAGGPRRTGDGYYEAVVEDPEGNEIEIVA